jgi:hypothetical protein
MQNFSVTQDNSFFSNPSIRWAQALPPFGPEWSFATLPLTRVEAGPVRRQLTRPLAWAFRHAALETLPDNVREKVSADGGFWQIHHIVPLSLGGSNGFMALVPDPLHVLIHKFITHQTASLEVGMTRFITLPWREGLVWPMSFSDFLKKQAHFITPPSTPEEEASPINAPHTNKERGRHPAPFGPSPQYRPPLAVARF